MRGARRQLIISRSTDSFLPRCRPSNDHAAQRIRVDTLVPIDPAALSARYYQPDELHAESEGAQLSRHVAAFLPRIVDREQTLRRINESVIPSNRSNTLLTRPEGTIRV